MRLFDLINKFAYLTVPNSERDIVGYLRRGALFSTRGSTLCPASDWWKVTPPSFPRSGRNLHQCQWWKYGGTVIEGVSLMHIFLCHIMTGGDAVEDVVRKRDDEQCASHSVSMRGAGTAVKWRLCDLRGLID